MASGRNKTDLGKGKKLLSSAGDANAMDASLLQEMINALRDDMQ